MQVLPVMEHFYTIQGEGFHQGRAAYFIRLGGCDVGCVWCDVKESWDAENHPKLSVNEIIQIIEENQNQINGKNAKPIIVITGGEPLMHNLDELTSGLNQKGYQTNIETSGSHPLSGRWNWICLSPKKFKSPLPEILPIANELKIVIYNQSDFKWAEKYASLVHKDCKLYLQPEWEKSNIMMPLIIDYIHQHPEWELSLQIHKYIQVP